jgi:hypothetical protein
LTIPFLDIERGAGCPYRTPDGHDEPRTGDRVDADMTRLPAALSAHERRRGPAADGTTATRAGC